MVAIATMVLELKVARAGCHTPCSLELFAITLSQLYFSTVFLDSFFHLYFSAPHLNCTSPAVLLNYISRLNSGYNNLKVARAMAVTAVLNIMGGSPLVYHSTHPF